MGTEGKPKTVVACYTTEGNLVRTYANAKKASLSLHLFRRSVDKAIRENKIIHNMMWRRFPVDEVPTAIEPFIKKAITYNPKPVGLLDKDGNIAEVYGSLREAAKKNEVDSHTVRDMLYGKCKTAKGKRYRFLSEEEAKEFGISTDRYFGKTKVRQYALDGTFVAVYESLKKAAKKVKVHPSTISLCIRGLSKTAAGYYWIKDDEHAEETLAKLLSSKGYFYKTVIQLDLDGKIIAKYTSTSNASKAIGINGKLINQAIRRNETAGGYYWKGEK